MDRKINLTFCYKQGCNICVYVYVYKVRWTFNRFHSRFVDSKAIHCMCSQSYVTKPSSEANRFCVSFFFLFFSKTQLELVFKLYVCDSYIIKQHTQSLPRNTTYIQRNNEYIIIFGLFVFCSINVFNIVAKRIILY